MRVLALGLITIGLIGCSQTTGTGPSYEERHNTNAKDVTTIHGTKDMNSYQRRYDTNPYITNYRGK